MYSPVTCTRERAHTGIHSHGPVLLQRQKFAIPYYGVIIIRLLDNNSIKQHAQGLTWTCAISKTTMLRRPSTPSAMHSFGKGLSIVTQMCYPEGISYDMHVSSSSYDMHVSSSSYDMHVSSSSYDMHVSSSSYDMHVLC